jgi:hypothetical protein
MTLLARDPLAALEAALDRQRSSILSGAFDTLAEIEAAIQAAMSALRTFPTAPANMHRLSTIKAQAAHQGRLLQAALRGVQDARGARTTGKAFTSYDSAGRAGQIGTPRPRFERRR